MDYDTYIEHFRTIVFMDIHGVYHCLMVYKPNYNWGAQPCWPIRISCLQEDHSSPTVSSVAWIPTWIWQRWGVYRYTGMPPYIYIMYIHIIYIYIHPVVYLFNDKPWTQLSYCWCLSVDVIWIPFCPQSFWFIIAVTSFYSPIFAVHSISFQH